MHSHQQHRAGPALPGPHARVSRLDRDRPRHGDGARSAGRRSVSPDAGHDDDQRRRGHAERDQSRGAEGRGKDAVGCEEVHEEDYEGEEE